MLIENKENVNRRKLGYFQREAIFEALSFFGKDGRGLHDSLPNTYVVKRR